MFNSQRVAVVAFNCSCVLRGFLVAALGAGRGMIESKAIIEGPYRYMLTRRWGKGPRCVFVMLNPSTANAEQDDPTIRRCLGFAKREGCGSLAVVNLFALRATDPKMLRQVNDPIGKHNNYWIRRAISDARGPVIAAWGNHGSFMNRSLDVLANISQDRFQSFGLTKAGEPRHPLYVKSDAPLIQLIAREVGE